MKTMLQIIQNDPEVPPGNLLDHLVIPHVVHHPYRDGFLPEPEHTSALIVLGGAMGADDDQSHPFLADLKNLIRAILARSVPYLGICLGGQLLATALGARVASNRWEELGTLSVSLTDEGRADRLFSGVAEQFATFQWHHDSFDIPAEGTLLAASAACPHQAFRVGTCAWGVQFHPEVTAAIIRDWCAWDAATSARVEELVAEFNTHAGDYRMTARRLLLNFLQAAGLAAGPGRTTGMG